MTVIFACTFPGGAAIAADTLLHNPDSMQPVMNASKILTIGQRVAIAQAGSFQRNPRGLGTARTAAFRAGDPLRRR
ncbi:hypothetical protein Brsp07_00644 [Brucella sp. NBRC 14130]